MDRRNCWSKKKQLVSKLRQNMEKIEIEKAKLKEKNNELRRVIECRQNAIHLAAAVLIQIEAKDEKITNVQECGGCNQCKGEDGCYIVEILK